ncbi:MAG: hypothetical protein BECKG1743F_GA0114225_103523 [Candidatus Kentron sp. G]|nr:MAG: hypothetical protein BECKG1743F_GA0114225_103523 [Candidatus Kentron sp. G]VFN00922.1 MAG: hypothetical protein BECKG1743E_GA0114224_103633 [Candidatus Kentron sp. G]
MFRVMNEHVLYENRVPRIYRILNSNGYVEEPITPGK